ncbi:MAG: tyrosine-type recombinase/integrase [Pseudomonadota bacterium]
MGKISIDLPPHVNGFKSKGKTYYYYMPGRGTRTRGKRQRIFGEPSDPEWWEQYQRLSGTPERRTNPNSFDELITAWQGSQKWRELAESTRIEWRRHCRRISNRCGPLEVRGVEPKHVLALQEKFASTPADANNTLKCLSSMLSWSVPRGWRTDNPCREIEKLKIGEGYDPWPWDAVERAEKELLPHLWQAAALAVYTGQRQSDVLLMERTAINDGMIWVCQEKTGKELLIPIHHKLAEVLDTIHHDADTILANTRGESWSRGKDGKFSGFKSAWRKAKPAFLKDAGLVYHGLRKTAVVTLLEVGCTDAQVAAITGQSREMIVHYAKKVSQVKLARAAMALWNENKQ